MAERINRSHDNLKPWERMGLKIAAIAALGAVALTGCGTEHAGASHSPDRPTASASATPGSSESSPTPSETAGSLSHDPAEGLKNAKAELAKMGETNLANSTVYNELSPSEQTEVEKNSQLSFMQFEKLSPEERAVVARVLSDAHSKEYLEGAKHLVLPGNYGKPMGEILSAAESYIPAGVADKQGKVNGAQDLYYWALSATPEDVVPSNNGQPYFQVQFERAIAAAMASTGDPQLLEDAKKIVGGSLYHGSEDVVSGGPAYDVEEWGHLTQRVNDLRTMNETKSNTLQVLGYPDAGTDRHHFANAVGGPYDGYPANVALGFEVYNSETQSLEPGVNNDGAGAASYQVVLFKDKNGHSRSTWAEFQTTASPDGSGIGVLEPNPTK